MWLWTVRGRSDELSPSCRFLLDDARRRDGLRLSAITAWELGMLTARGRLRLDMEPATWLREALARTAIPVVPVDWDVAFLSSALPGLLHGDPADRMLIATALHYGWTLITRDRRILDYGRAGHVRALDAGARVVRERRRRVLRAGR